jgi:hypothetical protein
MPDTAPRRINYLRMSITDRCNLRCGYCTYWQEFERLPPGEILIRGLCARVQLTGTATPGPGGASREAGNRQTWEDSMIRPMAKTPIAILDPAFYPCCPTPRRPLKKR